MVRQEDTTMPIAENGRWQNRREQNRGASKWGANGAYIGWEEGGLSVNRITGKDAAKTVSMPAQSSRR